MNTDNWEETLRREAARLKNEAPSGLDQRIMRAVASSSRPKPQMLLFRPAMLILAAAACALGLFYVSRPAAKPVLPIGPEIAMAKPALPIPAAAASWPNPAELLQKDPLQDEANSVYSDARSAVNFLAMNFLPSTPQKSG